MLDTVKINHVQHISFTQSRLTDAVSVILRELLSYEHPPKDRMFLFSIVFVHRNTRSMGELVECGPWVGHSSVSLSQRAVGIHAFLIDAPLLSGSSCCYWA